MHFWGLILNYLNLLFVMLRDLGTLLSQLTKDLEQIFPVILV